MHTEKKKSKPDIENLDDHSLHWADQLAEQIIERARRENVIPNIKCQQTPSGGKHIGNLNDVIRGYFPYRTILEKGEKATFVHTTDDRDPLKDVPKKFADLDGKWHPSENFEMNKYLGMPLFMVPDPFGCCSSWSVHFTEVWMKGIYALGMNPQLYSVNDLYEKGKFDPYIIMLFEKIKEAGLISSKFQKTKTESYIPFDAICPNCNQLGNIDAFDLGKKEVHFICGGKAIKKKKSEGCGSENWTSWKNGKLQWRFEWPALWGIFHTTFEPFGKDHAEGSWPSGQEIARKIFRVEPPIPYVYEFFLVNGEKMSASVGNVYIVQDMLEIIEPEVFRFFYTKRPDRQRNLDISRIFSLVDEFDEAERIYFKSHLEREAEVEKNDRKINNIIRMYEFSSLEKPKIARMPVRIPYQFAAMISQTTGIDRATELLKFMGHDVKPEDIPSIKNRLALAQNWVTKYAPEMAIDIRLHKIELSGYEKKALADLCVELKRDINEEELQSYVYQISRSYDIEPKHFFSIIYQILTGKTSGPRLGAFIIAIGKDKIRNILESL